MRQPLLNLDELYNTLNRLSMEARALRIRLQGHRQLDLEAVERYTEAVRRVNTSKESEMARTPYVTVRGPEPAPPAPQPKETTMPTEFERRPLQQDKPEDPGDYTKPVDEEEEEKKPPEPIDFDADRADALLDVVHKTKDLPALLALNQAAMINLTIMAAEVQEELNNRAEEAKKEAEEKEAKKEKRRQDRLKEVEDEKVLAEKKEREEREKAAKEREAARQKEPANA